MTKLEGAHTGGELCLCSCHRYSSMNKKTCGILTRLRCGYCHVPIAYHDAHTGYTSRFVCFRCSNGNHMQIGKIDHDAVNGVILLQRDAKRLFRKEELDLSIRTRTENKRTLEFVGFINWKKR